MSTFQFSRPISRADFVRTISQAFVIAYLPAGKRRGFPHPEPREGITAENVLSVEALGESAGKKVLEVYEHARTYPEIFDGLYCACRCSDGKQGHRSLLACYESRQPTGCGGCQHEADIAGKLAKQEKTLAEIRLAVDKAYG